MHAARGPERVAELAEHHREHVVKRALEATEHVAARARVVIDGMRDHRMRELQQRRASASEKHREIAAESPRDRARPENAGVRIVHIGNELGERRFELVSRDDHPCRVTGYHQPRA